MCGTYEYEVCSVNYINSKCTSNKIPTGLELKPNTIERCLLSALLVLLVYYRPHAAINVELLEILAIDDYEVDGEFEGSDSGTIDVTYGGVDPIDNDCEGKECIGMFTRVSQLRL